MTNLEVALFFGAGPLFGGDPPFHYLAGNYENDFPVDFRYVTLDQWFDFMEAGVPWESARFMLDYCALISDIVDVRFDDHYAEIDVPIFNVCPAGGFGELSIYGTTFLGSTDITHHSIQLQSAENALLDFGHIDLFIANNAEELFWQPLLEWMDQQSFGAVASVGETDF